MIRHADFISRMRIVSSIHSIPNQTIPGFKLSRLCLGLVLLSGISCYGAFSSLFCADIFWFRVNFAFTCLSELVSEISLQTGYVEKCCLELSAWVNCITQLAWVLGWHSN